MKQSLSVLLSYNLSGFSLGIRSLDLYEFWHGVRSAYEVVHAEYNLEFQGRVLNLQKSALFMKCYPEIP